MKTKREQCRITFSTKRINFEILNQHADGNEENQKRSVILSAYLIQA